MAQRRRERTAGQRARRRRRRLIAGLVLAGSATAASFLQVEPIERPPALAHLDRGGVSIIAHAGAQGHAPPNTMEAFDAAIELGADTLEMDLQVTADGEVATIHDGTVDRTTDGSGPVSELTLAQLQALDAGATWTDDDGDTPFAGQGVRHAALREVLATYPDTPLVVELKTDGGEAIIQPTIDLLVEFGRDDGTVIVASFSEDYLAPVRAQLPEVPTNMPESETTGFYVRQLVGLHPWWSPPGEVFQVPETFDGRLVVTPRFTRAAQRLGVDVQVWTVNEPDQMHRLLDAGAHGILTDYPDRMVAVLEERAAAEAADPGGYGAQLARIEQLQDTATWLTPLFQVLTFLGDEEFYLLVLPILFWSVHRRLGIRIGVMLLLSASINGIGKAFSATPRPSFLRPELGVVGEDSFGVPSGHTQNAVAIWGLLATAARSWAVRAVLVALIAGIAWSRFHLGVHFLEDLVTGAVVGLVLLGAFLWLEPRVVRWWGTLPTVDRVLVAVLSAAVLIAPAALLAGRLVGIDPGWPGVDDPGALAGVAPVVTPAAALAGFGIGLALAQRRGPVGTQGSIRARIARVLVGLVGVVLLVEGLGAVLPGGEGPLGVAARTLRYGLTGLWIAYLAPELFVRFGLATRTPSEPAPAAITANER
ncbi:MAG: phosphatase PAP2 family protein [Nitriliruptoraceae bacterium]|nr:phosphatase PAP2 family protein [Nitriliruptoraceae bacterium]